jgi:hypothetical protein
MKDTILDVFSISVRNVFSVLFLLGDAIRDSLSQTCAVCCAPSAIPVRGIAFPSSGSDIAQFLADHGIDVVLGAEECRLCVSCVATLANCDKLEVLLCKGVEKLRVAVQRRLATAEASSSCPVATTGDGTVVPDEKVSCRCRLVALVSRLLDSLTVPVRFQVLNMAKS